MHVKSVETQTSSRGYGVKLEERMSYYSLDQWRNRILSPPLQSQVCGGVRYAPELDHSSKSPRSVTKSPRVAE
ncbi:hypothetical protein TNCV_4097531 [Trichonephila clavipes]|nr:hypothetical protein TNCV_4097531 [Trichonephila clavipes]